jgi:hypothetical protein
MELQYIYTAEKKAEWWGDGEWVNEPDLVEFSHNGIECKIIRQAIQEPCIEKNHIFGGHLCGYVFIPKDHPYFGKEDCVNDLEVHGGITYNSFNGDIHQIGFDCAHFGDIVPSMTKIKDSLMQEFQDQFPKLPSPWKDEYRNMEYVTKECISLAKQIIAADIKQHRQQ